MARFGSLADMPDLGRHVRFASEIGHLAWPLARLQSAKSRHRALRGTPACYRLSMKRREFITLLGGASLVLLGHSTTLSASTSSFGGISTRSVLAVVELSTSSNFAGCMTGRSEVRTEIAKDAPATPAR